MHLPQPLAHLCELLLEALAEPLRLGEQRVPLLPVRLAVVDDEPHVARERLGRPVRPPVHLGLDRQEVHGRLDLFEVVGHAVGCGVYWGAEGLDEAGPVACVAG